MNEYAYEMMLKKEGKVIDGASSILHPASQAGGFYTC